MYRNFADVARACAQRGIGPAQLFLESECRLTERAPDEVRAQLRERWAVMEASARQALEAPQRTAGGLIDGMAHRQWTYAPGQSLCGPFLNRVMARALSCSEVNASMGRICAAPTAGLHFTPELMDKLTAKGVGVIDVLLHVGLGTFRPVQVDDIKDHKMHSEYWQITEEAAKALNEAKMQKKRIVCVGTTSVRVLESAAKEDGTFEAGHGETSIFIYPPYRFKAVDALITNFHLPESTLIMLVSALCGREQTLRVYNEAVKERYRFFSFGDAMLIL